MAETIDVTAIEALGWRQGAVLGEGLFQVARDAAPPEIREQIQETDWIIVTSHDCDVVNPKLEKEPLVELLRAVPLDRGKPDKQQTWGRNPRTLQLEVKCEIEKQAPPPSPSGNAPPPTAPSLSATETVILGCSVHQRWPFPRQHLVCAPPRVQLPGKECRLVAEWLAKRYIRAAFPGAFDARWRGPGSSNLKEWTKLLSAFSGLIQGVYLRLSTLDELGEDKQYRCHLIIATTRSERDNVDWVKATEELEKEVDAFWVQFSPGIVCDGVEVCGTDEITLADIEPYQRFDADWVSFADDTAMTPLIADMTR